ncbi:hypothetical protein ACQKPX_20610 [Photobacterium sp. DNB23_23_1]
MKKTIVLGSITIYTAPAYTTEYLFLSCQLGTNFSGNHGSAKYPDPARRHPRPVGLHHVGCRPDLFQVPPACKCNGDPQPPGDLVVRVSCTDIDG